jgi:hypothetical protein
MRVFISKKKQSKVNYYSQRPLTFFFLISVFAGMTRGAKGDQWRKITVAIDANGKNDWKRKRENAGGEQECKKPAEKNSETWRDKRRKGGR